MERILVLGASGMLGHAVVNALGESNAASIIPAVRSAGSVKYLPISQHASALSGFDAESHDSLVRVFDVARPTVVVNCVGLVKQLGAASDPLSALPLNSLLPHRLSRLCSFGGARLIHVSTDCVFSGRRGMYKETDSPDAEDLYGRSKLLGEVDERHCITLRTSIIGHNPVARHGLVDWFLEQTGRVNGFSSAIFSGLPTIELARLIRDHVLPNQSLSGVYHVSADPISKYALLTLINRAYNTQIEIVEDSTVRIDRSLDSTRFRKDAGYTPPSWPKLVDLMHQYFCQTNPHRSNVQK